MNWSFTSDNNRKVALRRGGTGKYRLTLKGEMQTYNMKVKSTVCTDFLLRMKDISTSDVVINIIVFRKEMIDCTNPAFKEMFSVTRQLEKLYDEITIRISFEGKILDIYNMDRIIENWDRLKKENVQYFDSFTDISDFFRLNDEKVKDKEFWKEVLDEQEILFLLFQLPDYTLSFNHRKGMSRYNAFHSNSILWEIETAKADEQKDDSICTSKVTGLFNPGKEWVKKAYGSMPLLKDTNLSPKFNIYGHYNFDKETGWIEDGNVYMEEIVHSEKLWHKMDYNIQMIL